MTYSADSLIKALEMDDAQYLTNAANVDYGFVMAKNDEHFSGLFGTYQLLMKADVTAFQFHHALLSNSLNDFVASFFEKDGDGHIIDIYGGTYVRTPSYSMLLKNGGIKNVYTYTRM